MSRTASGTLIVGELHRELLALHSICGLRTPSSGSFVRPSAHGLSYGVSFLDALHNKYIDLTQANSETEETVVLGSSNGAIIVEAPGMNKVRGKFSRLDHLKEVSLDNELVALGNDADLIKKTCPSEVKLIARTLPNSNVGIRSLDLSMSLIASWDTVASIATGLSNLQRLSLKFVPVPSATSIHSSPPQQEQTAAGIVRKTATGCISVPNGAPTQ